MNEIEIYESVICPFGCSNSEKVEIRGSSTTLVGWSGGPDDNPNHHTQGCICHECGQSFTRHYVKSKKRAWYVDKNRNCILGVPACCESSYRIRCEKCSG